MYVANYGDTVANYGSVCIYEIENDPIWDTFIETIKA